MGGLEGGEEVTRVLGEEGEGLAVGGEFGREELGEFVMGGDGRGEGEGDGFAGLGAGEFGEEGNGVAVEGGEGGVGVAWEG